MDIKIVKIEGNYSIESHEENNYSHITSDEIQSAAVQTPWLHTSHDCESASDTATAFHPEIRSRSNLEKLSKPPGPCSSDLKLAHGPNVEKSTARREDRPKKRYKCKKCIKDFHAKHYLHVHIAQEHKGEEARPYKCPSCPKSFVLKSSLNEHSISHSSLRPEICLVCSNSFKTSKHLRNHQQNQHNVRIPNGRSRRERELEGAAKTNLPLYKCKVCFKPFRFMGELNKHIKNCHPAETETVTVTGSKFNCDICPNKSYASKQNLRTHNYTVHGQRSKDLILFPCEFCQQQFTTTSKLKVHIVNKHVDVEDKEFECSVCLNKFIDQESLAKHFTKNHEKRYFCEVCPDIITGFRWRRELVGHLKEVHQRHYYCYKCGRYSFKNKFEFDEHLDWKGTSNDLNVPVKIKCQICSVSLSSQCNFNIHSDGHSNEAEERMQQSIKTEEGVGEEEIDPLKIMKDEFNDDVLHEEELISCSVCSMIFDRKAQLEDHRRIFHRILGVRPSAPPQVFNLLYLPSNFRLPS